MPEVYMTSQKLIATLGITDQELIDIEHFFDADANDEWELKEGKDYRVVVQANGLREYTSSGAYTIARYLEATKKQSFWAKLRDWFLQTKKKIRQAFIREKILDNCSSLVKRSDQFWITSSDLVAIFGTRADYLRKMAEAAQKSDMPLIKGKDFDDFGEDSGIYYSLSGIYKLAQAFRNSLTKKNRQEWCEDVGEVIQPQISEIVQQILNRNKEISKVMDRVKDKRDKKTCRVTNNKSTKINGLNLVAHHLYSKAEYPHLAANESNLITLTNDVHQQFHVQFMGGANKGCTIDDFIRFVQHYYPENHSVLVWLKDQKLALGNQQPVDSRKPHVLYLPASRVS